jgi:2-polyprenyl-3-methyl-5-hydroxy-6-metoxy-1,4-benzoquinol methylase
MTHAQSPDAVVAPARRHCVVCGSARADAVFQEFGVDIMECAECGHVYSSWPGGQDYDGYFSAAPIDAAAAQRFWDAQHARMYDDFIHRFMAGRSGRLLDVGCGLGYFVQRAAGVPGWQATGYEISSQAVRFARETLGLASVFCGRVEDSGFPTRSFEIITLWDVIEHIPDPDPLLAYLRSLLTDDGVLCMHTPNAVIQVPKARLKRRLRGMQPGLHYLEARDHINIYKVSTLRRVLERNGFSRVRFIHLSPIDAVADGGRMSRVLKRAWFAVAVALFHLTLGRVNIDNLFAVAQR